MPLIGVELSPLYDAETSLEIIAYEVKLVSDKDKKDEGVHVFDLSKDEDDGTFFLCDEQCSPLGKILTDQDLGQSFKTPFEAKTHIISIFTKIGWL